MRRKVNKAVYIIQARSWIGHDKTVSKHLYGDRHTCYSEILMNHEICSKFSYCHARIGRDSFSSYLNLLLASKSHDSINHILETNSIANRHFVLQLHNEVVRPRIFTYNDLFVLKSKILKLSCKQYCSKIENVVSVILAFYHAKLTHLIHDATLVLGNALVY